MKKYNKRNMGSELFLRPHSLSEDSRTTPLTLIKTTSMLLHRFPFKDAALFFPDLGAPFTSTAIQLPYPTPPLGLRADQSKFFGLLITWGWYLIKHYYLANFCYIYQGFFFSIYKNQPKNKASAFF